MARADKKIFGSLICTMFGLNPKEVRSLTLHIEPDDVVTINAVIYLSAENSLKIENLMQTYQLTKIENDETH